MPGDRIFKTNFLPLESSVKYLEENVSEKEIASITNAVTTTPYNDQSYSQKGHDNVYTDQALAATTATAYKMYSNLNPNALEFVPSFKQTLEVNTETEQNLIQKPPNKIDYLIEDLKETYLGNASIEKGARMQDRIVNNVSINVENNALNPDKKLGKNTTHENHLVLWCESSSTVGNSEAVGTKFVSTELDYGKNLEMVDKTSLTNPEARRRNIPSSQQILLNEVKINDATKNRNHKNIDYCTANSVDKPPDEKSSQAIGSVLKTHGTENENKSKVACFNTLSSKSQCKITKNVTDSRKNLNVVMKIATPPPTPIGTTGTVRKVNLVKPSKMAELKRNGQPKNEAAMIIQCNNAKKCPTAQTSTNSKCCALPSNKTFTKSQRTEITKNLNKDAIHEKKISNRSYPHNTKIKYAEKLVVQGRIPKECLPITPRPTVSSKLRKAETQKVS